MNYKHGKWLQKEMIQFPHQLDVDPEGMVVLQCALEISAEHSDSYISFEDFLVTTADNNVQSYAEFIKKTLDEECRKNFAYFIAIREENGILESFSGKESSFMVA